MGPWVSFVPKAALGDVHKDYRIISIGDRYGTRPNLSRFTDPLILNIETTTGDCWLNPTITPELVKQIDEWVRKDELTPIVVHCGEGRVRSPAIARFIRSHYDRYLWDDYNLCGKTVYEDRGIERTLHRTASDLNIE